MVELNLRQILSRRANNLVCDEEMERETHDQDKKTDPAFGAGTSPLSTSQLLAWKDSGIFWAS